ncbi:MAG: PspC domain-containing protein [Rikenellaceae bacterium]|jgi:phage shock protein PspC (stress-responsive transcriptional regulator)|nr:PspC domain-containing protein [Rikenellaceae bacterium]
MKDMIHVNVSIAGIAFKLEESAYVRLDGYLQQLHDSYGNSSDGQEIVDDLEARIAEIILTRQDASTVVSVELIDTILQRLGAPEVISEGSDEEPRATSDPNQPQAEATPSSSTLPPPSSSPSRRKLPHRLYRNTDGAILGGVCNGLASYFNVDPVLVRLLFGAPLVLVVFFFFTRWQFVLFPGFMIAFVMFYLLLWIVVPSAKTPLQKLEMQGEEITKESLEQTFREEFQSRSNDPSNIELRARNERNASLFSELATVVGRILLFVAKALGVLIGFGLVAVTIFGLIALAVHIYEESGLSPSLRSISLWVLIPLLILFLLVPAILACYGILKWMFGLRGRKSFVSTLLVVWVITLVFGAVIILKNRSVYEARDLFLNPAREAGWRSRGAVRMSVVDWPNDFPAVGGNEVITTSSLIGKDARVSEFRALPMVGDTLWIAPMDTLRLSRFLVKIHRSDHPYTTPTEALRKYVTFQDNTISKRENRALDDITVERQLRGDTLFLRTDIPDLPGLSDERAEVDIYLPENKQAVVLDGVNFNEYY